MHNPTAVSSPADVLATVAHMLGYTPAESIVFLTMTGKKSGATLRVDKPAPGSDAADWAQTIVSYLLYDESADGVLIAVYTDADRRDGRPPFAEHIGAVQRELNTVEMPVKTGWLVTSTRWGNYFDPADQHHDPSEISDSAANAELIFHGSQAAGGNIPEDPAYTGGEATGDAIAEAASRYDGTDPLDFTAPAMREARALWAEAIGTGVDEAAAVALVATLHNKGMRDRIMADLIDPSDEPEAFRQTLTGQTTTAPDWARVDAAGQLITDLLAATPTQYRAPLFTMQGWLSWYKGRSTLAAAYIDKATAADPGHELAKLLGELFELGILPETAKNAATAYRRS